MSHLLELKDGRIVRVESFDEVADGELQTLIQEAKDRVATLESFGQATSVETPAEEPTPEPTPEPQPEQPTPVDEAPVEQGQPEATTEPVTLTTTPQETPATPAPVQLQ